MRFAISKNNQLLSAMPTGQQIRGYTNSSIRQPPCLGGDAATQNHMRAEPHSRERSFESERRAQPDGYSLTDLNEHRLDEIGGEKPRASLAVGDQNKHHGAVRTRHDRVIAGRKRSRNRQNCDVERPHELELLGCKISDLGNRLDGG